MRSRILSAAVPMQGKNISECNEAFKASIIRICKRIDYEHTDFWS